MTYRIVKRKRSYFIEKKKNFLYKWECALHKWGTDWTTADKTEAEKELNLLIDGYYDKKVIKKVKVKRRK